MKDFKKYMALAASASLVVTVAAPTVEASSFSDTVNTKYEKAAQWIVDYHVMKPTKTNTFSPSEKVTRKEMIEYVGRYLEMEHYDRPFEYLNLKTFSDLGGSKVSSNLFEYSLLIKDLNIVSSQYLKPNAILTKEDMAEILVKTYSEVKGFDIVNYVAAQSYKKDITDTASAKKSAQGAINVLDYYNIANNKYFPKSGASRGEFAYLLYELMKIEPPAEGIKLVAATNSKTLKVYLNDNSTHTVKLQTPLQMNKLTTVNFKINGKKYRGVTKLTKEPEVVKTEVVSRYEGNVYLSNGKMFKQSNKNYIPLRKNVIYSSGFGGGDYYYEFKVKDSTMESTGFSDIQKVYFKISFSDRLLLPLSMTGKEAEKYITITNTATNKVVPISHAKLINTRDEITVVTNGVLLDGAFKVTMKNIKSVRHVKLEESSDLIIPNVKRIDNNQPYAWMAPSGPMRLEINFSEPVKPLTLKNIKIKTKSGATVTNLQVGQQTKAVDRVYVNFSNAKVNGKPFKPQVVYPVLSGIKDFAGNSLEKEAGKPAFYIDK